ncbi:MAG TPA: response regulator [Pirellulales bacterium]|nr:response regulator [Pirellulales bacterium]
MSSLPTCPTRPRILCIDDDAAILAALTTRFKPYDVEVLTACNGKHGIWLAVTEKPDVVVTDLRMPHGDGDYLVECLKMRPDTWDIPVIVLTGVNDRETRRWMLTLGVSAYLNKPLSFDALVAAVRRQIEIKPQEAVAR